MYACGARTIPTSSMLVSAGHSVSPSGEQVWSAVSSPGIPLAFAVGSGQSGGRRPPYRPGASVAPRRYVDRMRRDKAGTILCPCPARDQINSQLSGRRTCKIEARPLLCLPPFGCFLGSTSSGVLFCDCSGRARMEQDPEELQHSLYATGLRG